MAQGIWMLHKEQMHINILELWTAHHAFWVFLSLIRSCHIQLLSNNMTVDMYINKQRGI